jgi:hypothetical protein
MASEQTSTQIEVIPPETLVSIFERHWQAFELEVGSRLPRQQDLEVGLMVLHRRVSRREGIFKRLRLSFNFCEQR